MGIIAKACAEAGYILAITADHGNAEQMLNPDTGAPHTAHTTNKVPFILTGGGKFKFKEDKPKGKAESKAESKEEKKAEELEEEEGALCDVAPTILDILVCHFVLFCVDGI